MDIYSESLEFPRSKVVILYIIAAIFIAGLVIYDFELQKNEADLALVRNLENALNLEKELMVLEENTLISVSNPSEPAPKVVKKMSVVVTAYSSTVWETDDTPYITAAGTWVRDGIIANNSLPFGTKVRFPEIYGDKIFVVEDRMHWRKGSYCVDIWFPSYSEAKNFGAKRTYLEVLEG